jgi:thioredoxin reductase (NADPH)
MSTVGSRRTGFVWSKSRCGIIQILIYPEYSFMGNGNNLYDIVIIGGGPGGMTSGLYAARGEAKTLLINKGALGGMVLMTVKYDNFPSYPGGVESFELAQRLEEHMREFAIQVEMDNVATLRHYGNGPLFEIVCDEGNYVSKSVIVATGSMPKLLDAPGTTKLFGRGVSICAVCDGAFYRGKDVAVVGGGDSAVEEGIYLTRFANSVRIIHRRNELRASPLSSDEAFKNPKVHFVWDSVVTEVLGENKVEGVNIKNVKTGEISKLDVSGVFIYIGATGNTGFIELPVEMNAEGYIRTSLQGETNIPGLFAVGDVRDEPFKQAIIACGHGASASLMAEKYIKTIPKDVLEGFSQVKR